MDMRAKPIDTKSGNCWNCFGCRRRSLSSKVTPVVLQVIVVTVIWFVIRKTCYTSNQVDNVAGRVVRSADDQGISMCSQGEYIKGTSLKLQDIVSLSGSLEPGEQRFFLQVDILTRNTDNDSPTLYTVGTPVIVDGLFEDKEEDSGELGDKEKAEFYYDNSIDEKDMGDFLSEDANKANEGKEQDSWQGGANVFADLVVKRENDDIVGSNEAMGGLVGKENNYMSQNGQVNNVIRGNAVQTFQNANTNSEQNNVNQISNGRNPPAMQLEQDGQPQAQAFQQNQLGVSGMLNQNNQQAPPGLQFQPRLNQIGQQFGVSNQLDVNQIRQAIQTNQQGYSNDVIDQQGQLLKNNLLPSLHRRLDNLDGKIENIMNPGTLPIDNYPDVNEGGIRIDQAQGMAPLEKLNVEGFKERLTRFKTEYYGRPIDDSSDHTTTSYALNNPVLCENVDKIDVLFVINAIPQSDEQRQRIRETFAKASLFEPFSISHVFMVGLTSSPNFQGNLDKEHEEYGDIVQGEFMDKPETKTLKGLMGFRWVTTFCTKARFVFKLDEDVFVDTDKLLQGLIPAVDNVIGEKAMLCFFVQNAPVPRSGPNAFDQNIFPKSSRMRPYCKGFAVLTTVNTISSLVAASEHVPLFHFDDLYLYGILPFVVGGVEVYDLGNKRGFHDFGKAVVDCYKDLQDSCPHVATKAFSSRFTSLWEFVTTRRTTGSSTFQGDPSLWNIAAFRSTFYS